MMAVHICTVMVTMCCAAARMSYPNFVTRPATSHKSSRGPCSFSDKLSIKITTRRMASLIASAHSIVPSLQARIQNAARRRITPTNLGSEALALTGGVGRGRGVLTALSASRMSFADSSALDSRHNRRKISTACKLSENLCSVLINATTSERCRRLEFNRGSKFFSSSSKRTFKAVPRPVV